MPRGGSVLGTKSSELFRFGKQIFNNASEPVGSGFIFLGVISVRKSDF